MRVDFGRLREQVGNIRSDFAILVGVGVIVGICGSLAGVALHWAIEHLSILEKVRGETLGARALLVVLPAIGAALSWLFLRRIAHESEHNVADLIWSASREGGELPRRGVFSQLVAVWLTVGTGGSAGPEGPVVYSGAAIGSSIAGGLRLSERRRISLLGCGVAASASAIFNAPVTGLLFAVEIVLGDWASRHILPIAIASVVANVTAGALIPGDKIFHIEGIETVATSDYFWIIGLAVLTGLGAYLFVNAIRFGGMLFRKHHHPALWKVIAGGLVVGLIGLACPEALGIGYEPIRQAFFGGFQGTGFAMIGMIALVKIVATGITLGSGSCGGVFAPALFAGSFIGLAYHGMLVQIGALGDSTAQHAGVFALIGMAGMMGGALHAPLTAIFLVAEITGNYNLLLPLILVTACSQIVAMWLEPKGLHGRELVEGHGDDNLIGLDARILADISLQEIMVPPDVVLHDNAKVTAIRDLIQGSDHDVFPVVDDAEQLVGILRSHHLLGHDPGVESFLVVADVMDASWPSVATTAPVDEIVPLFADVHVVAVAAEDGSLVGFVSARKLLLRYRQELLIHTGG